MQRGNFCEEDDRNHKDGSGRDKEGYRHIFNDSTVFEDLAPHQEFLRGLSCFVCSAFRTLSKTTDLTL